MTAAGLLAAAVLGFMFLGRVPFWLLATVCAGAGGALAVLGRHSHEGILPADQLARRSRLQCVSPGLKFWTVLALICLCLCGRSVWCGTALTILAAVLITAVGGVHLHDYLHLLAVPLIFLLLSLLALLWQFGPEAAGVMSFPAFGGFFSVTAAAQLRTELLAARVLGAVSCLYLLSLSTTVSQIIGVLRRARCPDIVAELMYLIYRYIFVLLEMHRTMKDAAGSRMGYRNWRTGLRTTGKIYANLLARSYRQASKNFDAMESRCYEGQICFLESRRPLRTAHALTALAVTAFAAGIALIPG